MYCKKCKKKIDDDSKFCEFCSAKIPWGDQRVELKFKIFTKKAMIFWLFLLGMALLISAFFIGNENNDSLYSNEAFYTFLRLYIQFC